MTKGARRKYEQRPEMSREDITEELLRMQAEGHSMKSADFEPWFYDKVNTVFGGYKQAKAELGLVSERKKGTGSNRERSLADVIKETQSAVTRVESYKEFREKYRHIVEYSRRHLGDSRAIFKEAGVDQPPYKRRIMSKEVLDAIIKRRIDEGKTLVINQIDDEDSSSGIIQSAAVEHYGSWTEARAAHEAEITKESVAKELLRLQKEGHSMKSGDFDPSFYRQISQTFGGYQQAKYELGIVTKKNGGGLKKRNLDDVIKETRLAVAEVKDWGEFFEKYRYLTDYSRRHLGSMNEIFTLAGVEKPPRSKPKRVRSKWTLEFTKTELERVATEYGSVSANFLKEQGCISLVDAVRSHFGTWNAGLIALGYEVAHESPKMDWTSDSLTDAVLNTLANGTKPTTQEISKEVRGFGSAVNKLFGGYVNFKEHAGYCTLRDKPPVKIDKIKKYSPSLKNAAGIHREIIRLWYIGEPLNYRHTRDTRGHFLAAANKHIGSWREAIESVGIDYEDVSIDMDTNILSECGYEFEDVVAEILDELGTKYTRDGHEHLRPDFITEEGRWIDAKLSEWTDISEMLKKYDGYHDGLTVIYLRGKDMRRNRGVKREYEHVSVYQLLREMPKCKRSYFEGKLDAIEAKADACAVAN